MTSGNAADSQGSTDSTGLSLNDAPAPLALARPGVVVVFPPRLGGAAVWPVRDALVVGRASSAAIQLADSNLSRRHATLDRAPDGLRVTDLGSSHGTFVDGERTTTAGTLAPFGSIIRIGGTLLLVVQDVGAHSAAVQRVCGELLGLAHDMLAGPQLAPVWQQAMSLASLSHPVLILGESGSGKKAVARLIHAKRANPGPFVAINLAAIPPNLLESELFGHVRGAVTGALSARAGAFARASGGVLFVDEVADLRPELQVKLLRALDEMRVLPVGADVEVAVQVRLVAATSQDLRAACAKGSFRADLYYRLAGIVLRVPALRERRADILLLANAFLQQENPQLSLSVCAAETLALAHWRGNVRELYYAVARASAEAKASGSLEVRPEHLPALDELALGEDGPTSAERIRAALLAAKGNASRAARALGVSRSGFYNLLKRHGLDPALIRGGRR